MSGATRPAQVRLGGEDDLGGVAAVHLATRRSAYASLLPAEVLGAMSNASLQQWWEQRLRSAPYPHRLLIASSEAPLEREVLGFVHIGPGEDGPGGSEPGELYAIHVHPHRQGAGLGAQLLGAACEALQTDLGYERARLWVLEGNQNAQGFYRWHGWQLVNKLRRTEEIDGVPVAEVAYERNLADDRA